MGRRGRSGRGWRSAAVVAVAATGLGSLAPPARAAGGSYDQVVDLTFPTAPSVTFGHDYHAPRSGGRVHEATDLMGPKMTPLYAAVAGTVCSITGVDSPPPSWGMAISVCGDDGRRYAYLHVNNDTPGTDDGASRPEHAYAPGIRHGVRVARGQLIAYMGDSGNAETTAPHLHFEIHDPTVTDPYGDHRIDPYFSLVDALARGDVADGTAVHLDPVDRVAGGDRIATAIALSRAAFDHADHVVLAPAESAAEAIVAGPLAASLGGPVLTTWSDRLEPAVAAELSRLGATAVTVVGGVGDAVVDALGGAGMDPAAVRRLRGPDRYATAALVAEQVWTRAGGEAPATPVVTGTALAADHPRPVLVVSTSPDRAAPVLLDGATVGGEVFVSAETGAPAARVDFWVDDATGSPDHTEGRAPFDLGGTTDSGLAGAVDTRALSPGEHRLTAVVTWADGTTATVAATFTVRNVGPRRALLALGEHPDPVRSWPDALMASWYGAAAGVPVLLTAPDRLPDTTAAALDGAVEVVVVGGEAAIATAVTDLLAGRVGGLRRLAGPTRYSTAVAVARELVSRGAALDRVWAATGRNWPDAVAAGPAVAAAGDTLVLVDGAFGGADGETADWLAPRAGAIASGRVIGGVVAVSDGAATELARRIT